MTLKPVPKLDLRWASASGAVFGVVYALVEMTFFEPPQSTAYQIGGCLGGALACAVLFAAFAAFWNFARLR